MPSINYARSLATDETAQLRSKRRGHERWRWRLRAVSVAALSGMLVVGTVVGFPSRVTAAPTSYSVTTNLNVRETPYIKAAITGSIFAGERVSILCQEEGSSISGTVLWNYVEYNVTNSNSKKRGYVSDKYVSTGTSGRLPGVPYGNCRGLSPTEPHDQSQACSSPYVEHVTVRGYGQRVAISMTPTSLGRKHGTEHGRWQAVYAACVDNILPARLTDYQLQSLEKQYFCHDENDRRFPRLAGPTWDLESYRMNPSWENNGNSRCQYESAGPIVTLSASNYPHMVIAADKGAQAVLRDAAEAGVSGRFRLVLGLAGKGYSFQRVNEKDEGTDFYLRHRGGMLTLQAVKFHTYIPADPLVAYDSTFIEHARPGAPSQASYRSYNYSDHYIRHYNGRLEIGTRFTHRGGAFDADRWFIRKG